MRKLFTSLCFALAATAAVAEDYTGQLSVTINNGTPSVQETTISVTEDNGKYTLSLKKFKLKIGKVTMNVGDINITGVEPLSNGQYTLLKTSQKVKITKPSDAGIFETWLGPTLGEVPVNMAGELHDGKFYTIIDISMASLGQEIRVVFGDDNYQLPNSGFETYHTATVSMGENSSSSDEPDYWHSFMSASSDIPALVYLAGYNPVTFISDDKRPGSTGSHSLMLKSIDMGIAIANGTVTTGRMNTGSATASNTDLNYAWSDMASTDKDAHGDPFFSTFYGRPDSIKVWVKFKQGTATPDYPYATATAIITDGTMFHEPAPTDVTYTNIVGEARNPQIAETGDKWAELAIPFSYDAFAQNGVKAKSVLVTLSTNAGAGQGSDGDVLYVDDLSFVYNGGLKSVGIGDDLVVDGVKSDVLEYNVTVPFDVTADMIHAVSDGAGAYVKTTLEDADGGKKATIEVTSNDLITSNTYVVNIKKGEKGGVVSGISGTVAPSAAPAGIYTTDGVRVADMSRLGLYIVRSADGSAKKVLKK